MCLDEVEEAERLSNGSKNRNRERFEEREVWLGLYVECQSVYKNMKMLKGYLYYYVGWGHIGKESGQEGRSL